MRETALLTTASLLSLLLLTLHITDDIVRGISKAASAARSITPVGALILRTLTRRQASNPDPALSPLPPK